MASDRREKSIDERMLEIEGQGGKHEFKVEVWASPGTAARVLCIGPRPGRHLFYSFECPTESGRVNWAHITYELKSRVTEMNKQRFYNYYGPEGVYTKEGRKNA